MKQDDIIILALLAGGIYYIYTQSIKQLPIPSTTAPAAAVNPVTAAPIVTNTTGFQVTASPAPSSGLNLNFF